MKRLFFILPSVALCLLCSCSPMENIRDGNAVSVSFTLEAGGGTRATSALPKDSTVRVIAYRQVQGQTGYPEMSRAAECTYKVDDAGKLILCAVRTDGSVDATGSTAGEMELAPGTYHFYTISPALRVYHEDADPMVAVKHRTDFAVSVSTQSVVAGVNNIALAPLNRKCARLKFKTERNGAFSGITKLRIQSMTLEEMPDEPAWATGTQSLDLPGNAYATSIRLGKNEFKVPQGSQDYQQEAELNCLPRPAKDFRMRVSVLYNNDTTPTILETTVKGMAFTEGSLNTLTVNFGQGTMEVKPQNDWEYVGMGDYVGAEDLNQNTGGRTANCYIITDNASKAYCFNATVRGNGANVPGIDYASLPNLATATEARVIWQTGGWTSVVKNVHFLNSKVYFQTGTATEGNAVIGIFATSAPDAPCLWSWHIWKVNGALPPDVLCSKYLAGDPNVTTTFYMMGLSLGAYNNTPGDVGSMGLLYQWGRKDPFPGAANFSNTEPSNIYGQFNNGGAMGNWNGTYSAQVISTNASVGTENYAIKYPTAFIVGIASNGFFDWCWNRRNDNLWGSPWEDGGIGGYNKNQGTKTIYDPCPTGYRVPPQDTWNKQSKNGIFNDNGMILQSFASTFWLPAAGTRNGGNATLGGVSIYGYYYSSSIYADGDDFGGFMSFHNPMIVPRDGNGRAAALSIHCVAE